MEIYDTVIWLRSQSSGKLFPAVQFAADTDTATDGWVCLTSVERPEIVVTKITASEHQATATSLLANVDVEGRVNAVLGRHDLRIVWLVSAESAELPAAGASFQEFRKTYRPPRLYYRDIFDSDSLAECVSMESREQFERGGGVFTVL